MSAKKRHGFENKIHLFEEFLLIKDNFIIANRF